MNLFLVTSALSTNYSIFPIEERLQQTLDTATSIKKYAPGSKLVLVEGGKPIGQDTKDKLLVEYDNIFDFTSHDAMKFSQSPEHLKYDSVGHSIKSPCEAYILNEACKIITGDFDRIFKLSARYQLTDRFNLEDHMSAEGQWVFLTRAPAGTHGIVDEKTNVMTGGKVPKDWADWCYETTFYSFDGHQLTSAQSVFNQAFQKIVDIYSESNYIDIETTMYLILNQEQVKQVPVIGLTGALAMQKGSVIDK